MGQRRAGEMSEHMWVLQPYLENVAHAISTIVFTKLKTLCLLYKATADLSLLLLVSHTPHLSCPVVLPLQHMASASTSLAVRWCFMARRLSQRISRVRVTDLPYICSSRLPPSLQE